MMIACNTQSDLGQFGTIALACFRFARIFLVHPSPVEESDEGEGDNVAWCEPPVLI